MCPRVRVCVCENRWLWIAPTVKSLLTWTNWWRGSSTAAASPAVRTASRRGRWCSCIQQTLPRTRRHYQTRRASSNPRLTFCSPPTQTPTSTLTPTQTITFYRTHRTGGRSRTWSRLSLSSLPLSLLHPNCSVLKALSNYGFTLCLKDLLSPSRKKKTYRESHCCIHCINHASTLVCLNNACLHARA